MYRTVNGMVDSDKLGTTYIHEHLYVIPNDLPSYEDFTFDNIFYSISEINDFKQHGGNSIVDLTPINYGRNPIALKQISDATGTNILFVTGFHKEEFLPNCIDRLSDQEIYDFLMHEIYEGVSSLNLLPAALKIGTSFNEVTEKERRIIGISGCVQAESGIPMITHCDKGTMGLDQLNLLEKAGANLSKVCLSHVDLTQDVDYLKEICRRGAFISFDHIGRDLENHDMRKIQMLQELIVSGFENQICLAGDMGRKKYFKSYGGKPGLSYILTDFKKEALKISMNACLTK